MAEEKEALEKGMMHAEQLPPLPVDSYEEYEEKSEGWEEEKDAGSIADMIIDDSSASFEEEWDCNKVVY